MANQGTGNGLVIHGGGPTPVLNASLAGAIYEARHRPEFGRLWGARHGVAGALQGEFWDLLAQPHDVIDSLMRTPGSAIGSSRMHLEPQHYAELLDVLQKNDIRYVFVTGGNGTQDTGLRIAKTAEERGYELFVVGIPKTVDNDLGYTHFSPGYPSAARFYAQAVRDIGEDNRSLPTPINVTEIIGRNAGWVVGATALARKHEDDAPHLIYLPEQRLSEDQLCEDVEAVYRRLGRCVVAICEGQLNLSGEAFGADAHAPKGSRDRLASNLAHQVASLLTRRLGVRARSEKPGLLGRSCSLDVPVLDREAAFGCGAAAVRDAANGLSGHMVTIESPVEPGAPLHFGRVPFAQVAIAENTVPKEWIAASGNDVTAEFLAYALPLVGPIEGHPCLVG
jgi:6-phosphofructokinase